MLNVPASEAVNRCTVPRCRASTSPAWSKGGPGMTSTFASAQQEEPGLQDHITGALTGGRQQHEPGLKVEADLLHGPARQRELANFNHPSSISR